MLSHSESRIVSAMVPRLLCLSLFAPFNRGYSFAQCETYPNAVRDDECSVQSFRERVEVRLYTLD